MSNQADMLAQALKIIEEARGKNKTTEELINEQIERFRNIDIMAELKKMDRFDEITAALSEDEKAVFDEKAVEVISEHVDILDTFADALKDTKTREAILEELKRRVG